MSETNRNCSADDASETTELLLEAMVGNSELLMQLVADFSEFRQSLGSKPQPASPRESGFGDSEQMQRLERGFESLQSQIEDLQARNSELETKNNELETENSELSRQNSELAAKVANSNVQKSISQANSHSSESLSWEERKKLIFRQMEEDSFDADAFITNTMKKHLGQNDAADQAEEAPDPIAYVNNLHKEIERLERDIARRDKEIGELNHLLEQRPSHQQSGVAVGAAAIASMVDSDELIQQERGRLQQLQVEWEGKFRQAEIEASLERAKLSRERQELIKKTAELEEQLGHLQHDIRQSQQADGHSRKWLAKLGLAGNEN